MSSTQEKICRRGYRAWKRGDLASAIEILEALWSSEPGLIDAALPLARALHESGRSDGALEILDHVLPSGPRGANIHRALIEFDLEDHAALLESLEKLGPDNRPAVALRSLAHARRGRWEELELPEASLWSAEIVGRWLTLLEARFATLQSPDSDLFHHRLFTGSEVEKPGEPIDRKAVDVTSRDAWEEALEGCFLGLQFTDFVALWEDERIDAKWTAALGKDYFHYSLWATGEIDRLLKETRSLRESERDNVDLRFLDGLGHISAGRHLNATWSFVRAAELDDLQVHAAAIGLASELTEAASS